MKSNPSQSLHSSSDHLEGRNVLSLVGLQCSDDIPAVCK